MRKFLLILVITTSTLYVNAQNNDYQTFAQIETLLKKAEGATHWYAGISYTINKQTFGYNSVSTTRTRVVSNNIEKKVYTDILWPKTIKEKDLSFWGHPSHGLMYFFINLQNELHLKNYTNGKLIDNFFKEKMIMLYCLPEDKEVLIELFKKLLK
jgi:hypothetical protein